MRKVPDRFKKWDKFYNTWNNFYDYKRTVRVYRDNRQREAIDKGSQIKIGKGRWRSFNLDSSKVSLVAIQAEIRAELKRLRDEGKIPAHTEPTSSGTDSDKEDESKKKTDG